MSLTLEMPGQEQNEPENSLARTKCSLGTTVWVHNLSYSGWTSPQRGLEMQFNVPAEGHFTPGQLCSKRCHTGLWVSWRPPPPYSPGASIFSSRHCSPIPRGSMTQELAQHPGVSRKLAVG